MVQRVSTVAFEGIEARAVDVQVQGLAAWRTTNARQVQLGKRCVSGKHDQQFDRQRRCLAGKTSSLLVGIDRPPEFVHAAALLICQQVNAREESLVEEVSKRQMDCHARRWSVRLGIRVHERVVDVKIGVVALAVVNAALNFAVLAPKPRRDVHPRR